MFRAILRGRLSEYFPLKKRKFKRIAYDDDLAEVCQPPFKKRKLNPKEQLVSLLIKRQCTVEDIQRHAPLKSLGIECCRF